MTAGDQGEGQPPHLPDEAFYATLERPTVDRPLAILVSGCIAGRPCGVDGSDYGPHHLPGLLLASPRVRAVPFCPEHAAFGTPRMLCDIDEGTGFDVLQGRARVIAQDGSDWTGPMIAATAQMVALAVSSSVKLALLLDISAACGSQVIYQGSRLRPDPVRRPGMGVAAAALARAGIRILSQRDFASLERLFRFLDIAWPPGMPLRDHHRSDWYLETFGEGGGSTRCGIEGSPLATR